jgi:hypothetical protein
MAGTNKLIKYGTWSLESQNTYTDDELVALNTTQKQGIELGSIAYSDILNGLMRQLTHTNKAFSDLVVAKTDADVNTGITESVYSSRIELAIENIAKEVTITRLTSAPTSGETAVSASAISGDTLRSGITFSVDGLIKSVVRLQVGDLPTIATGTFLGRTATGDGTPSAILAADVLTAIGGVPTGRTIAGTALTANITRDTLIGVSEAGFVKRGSGANAYTTSSTVAVSEIANIASGTFLGRTDANSGAVSAISAANVLTAISGVSTARTIAGLDLTADRSRDDIIGVSSNGFVTRTGVNTYGIDATSYTPTSRTIAGLSLAENRTRDAIIGITDTSGVVVKTAANTYGVSDAYALDADVAYKVSDSPVDPTFWVGTEAQYNAITTKDSSVVYIIT